MERVRNMEMVGGRWIVSQGGGQCKEEDGKGRREMEGGKDGVSQGDGKGRRKMENVGGRWEKVEGRWNRSWVGERVGGRWREAAGTGQSNALSGRRSARR